MKKLYFSIIVILLFVSCAPKQPEQDTDIVAIDPNTDILTPIKQSCKTDDDGPRKNQVASPIDASSPITLSWDIDCKPHEYEVTITHYGNEASSVWISLFNPVNPNMDEWTKLITLEPATAYQWKLTAYTEDGIPLENKTATWGVFYTGPVCDAEDLVPPTLVSPADGTIDTGKGWGNETEVHAVIKYPVGECMPRYFEIDYSWNVDFSGEDSFNLGGPGGSTAKKDGDWWYFGDDSTATVNCYLYYWRARAVADNGSSDWSETFNFFLDVYGNCYKFPEFKGIQNANCRLDPWAGENYVGIIWEGDTAELIGLNEDASWGMFKLKNELECWVNMDSVEPDPPDTIFFPAFYPVLEYDDPPPDTEVPVEEPESEHEQGCMAPSGRSGALTCQIPCPDPNYASRVCP